MRHKPQREATAYHEAGHAVMRLELGRRPTRATIRPNPKEGSLGHVRHRPTSLDVEWFDPRDWRTQRWAQTEIMVALAGPEAERRFTGRRNHAGAGRDLDWVNDIILRAEGSGRRAGAYFRWLELKTRDWIALRLTWLQIEAVAAALLKHETLSGAEIRQICRDAVRADGPPLSPALLSPLSRFEKRS